MPLSGTVAGVRDALIAAKGDLIGGTAAGLRDRKQVGADLTVLTADSSSPVGFSWQVVGGGGFSSPYHALDAGHSIGLGASMPSLTGAGQNNTAVGYNVLAANTSAAFNTGVGSTALQANTTGANNSALGGQSLMANTTGANNAALGVNALKANTTGANNTACGKDALAANTIFSHNTAVGNQALKALVGGDKNTAVGKDSMLAATSAINNVAVGYQAMLACTTGGPNVAVGYQALMAMTTANNNVAIGDQALAASVADNSNVAVGHAAMFKNNGAGTSVAVGNSAAYSNLTGEALAVVGYNAGGWNTTGNNTTALGHRAARANTTGDNMTACGMDALYASTVGNDNTAVGWCALGYQARGVLANATFQSKRQTGVGARCGLSVADSRRDAATVTSGSSTVLDASVSAADAGKPVGETAEIGGPSLPAIPGGCFVGSGANAPVDGVSFTLVNASNVPVNAVGNSTGVTIGTTAIDGITTIGYYAGAGGNYATSLGYMTDAQAAGAVAIGADSGGTGASTTTPNEIALGTANHRTKIAGRLNVAQRTPSGSADAQGATGDIAADDNYVYVKASTGWKRAALATF